MPQVRKFAIAFLINVAVVAMVQIIQNIIGGPLRLGITYLKNDLVRYAIATFESNAVLGAFYSFALPIVVGFILTSTSPRLKIALTIFSIIISYTLFNTYSRSAYVGVVAGVFILATLKTKRFYLLLLALLIISPIFIQSTVFERITLTFQAWRPVVELDPSAQIRLVLWGKAFEIFKTNPIFGVGYWGARAQNFLGTEPHSQYLAYLTEMGIVGFGIFLWLISRIFKISLWVKNNARDNFIEGLGSGYVAGLSAVLVTCFFSESLEAFRMLGPLWFVTALVAASQNILSTQTETSKEEV